MTPINVFPSHGEKRNGTINIRSAIESNTSNTNYYATFMIMEHICYNPRITLFFEDTDFDGDNKFLNVYHNNKLTKSCGSNNNSCGDYKYCLNSDLILNGEPIAAGVEVVIHLEKGSDSNISNDCDNSSWADITLTCFADGFNIAVPNNTSLYEITNVSRSVAFDPTLTYIEGGDHFAMFTISDHDCLYPSLTIKYEGTFCNQSRISYNNQSIEQYEDTDYCVKNHILSQKIQQGTNIVIRINVDSGYYNPLIANLRLLCKPICDHISLFDLDGTDLDEFTFDNQTGNISIYRKTSIQYTEYATDITNNLQNQNNLHGKLPF